MIPWFRRYSERLARIYPDLIAFYRAQATAALTLAALILAAISLVGALPYLDPRMSREQTIVMFMVSLLLASSGFMLLLIDRGHSLIVQLIIFLALASLGLVSALYYEPFTVSPAYLLLIPLLGSMFFGTRGMLAGGGMAAGLLLLMIARAFETTSSMSSLMGNVGAVGASLLFGGVALWFFTVNLQTALARSQSGARQTQIVADILQLASQELESEKLRPQLVELIRAHLDAYHVQIFMLDMERQNAVLVASTGEAGERLLARKHSLLVGSRSVIGQAMSRGETVYAPDTSRDPIHRANELLPDTRAEIAFPLRDGMQMVGALDIQSSRLNAFSPDDIATLRIVAGQVATALRNARLYEQTRRSLEENRQLYEQAQENLRELDRLNRQLTAQVWGEYLSGDRSTIGVQLDGTRLKRDTGWTPTLRQVMARQEPIIRVEGEQQTVAVPLDVRGQVLGAIEVTLPPDANQQDAQDLIQAVAGRLGLALDNSRLFDEARTLAQQEHLINEIGEQLQSTTDIDEMLQIALTELQEALGASRGAIRLRAASVPATSIGGQE